MARSDGEAKCALVSCYHAHSENRYAHSEDFMKDKQIKAKWGLSKGRLSCYDEESDCLSIKAVRVERRKGSNILIVEGGPRSRLLLFLDFDTREEADEWEEDICKFTGQQYEPRPGLKRNKTSEMTKPHQKYREQRAKSTFADIPCTDVSTSQATSTEVSNLPDGEDSQEENPLEKEKIQQTIQEAAGEESCTTEVPNYRLHDDDSIMSAPKESAYPLLSPVKDDGAEGARNNETYDCQLSDDFLLSFDRAIADCSPPRSLKSFEPDSETLPTTNAQNQLTAKEARTILQASEIINIVLQRKCGEADQLYEVEQSGEQSTTHDPTDYTHVGNDAEEENKVLEKSLFQDGDRLVVKLVPRIFTNDQDTIRRHSETDTTNVNKPIQIVPGEIEKELITTGAGGQAMTSFQSTHETQREGNTELALTRRCDDFGIIESEESQC